MCQHNRAINHALCREEMPVPVCIARNSVGPSSQSERIAEVALSEIQEGQMVPLRTLEGAC